MASRGSHDSSHPPGLVAQLRALLDERDREATRARILADFSDALQDAASEREVLEHLARRASDVETGSLAIYRLTPEGRELEAVALQSHDEVAAEFRAMYARQPWRVGDGVMGEAIARGETVFRPYLDARARRAYLAGLPSDRREEMAARDLRAIVAVPLTERERVVGVLTLARYGADARPLDDSDRVFAEALAGRASAALGRLAEAAVQAEQAKRMVLLAEFLAEVVQASDELVVLERLVRAGADTLGAACMLVRETSDGDELEPIALSGYRASEAEALHVMFASQRWRRGEGIAGRVMATDAGVFLPYLDETERAAYVASLPEERRATMAALDVRGLIALPVHVAGRRAGIMTIARFGEGSLPFTERDRQFAEELVTRASVGLARIALREERRARLREREREAERAGLLAEFMIESAEATDELGVLQRLAQRSADALTAACLLFRVRSDVDELETIAVAGYAGMSTDDLREPLASGRRPGEGVAGEAYATGTTVVHRYLDDAQRERYLMTLAPERRATRLARIRAVIGVPLSANGTRVGSLVLARYDPDAAPFDDGDVAFAGELAARASIALGRVALLASRDRMSAMFRAVFDASPLATQLLRPDGTVALWNPAAERLFGFSAGEAIGHRPPTIPADQIEAELDMAARVARGEIVQALPAKRQRKDGSIVDVGLYGAAVPDERGGTAILGIYADVSEQSRLASEIRATSERLRATLDASPLPIITTDAAMRVTYWNPAAEAVYGWTAAEAVGAPPRYAPPDDPGAVAAAFERVKAGEYVVEESERQTRDGRLRTVSVHSVGLRDEAGRFVGAVTIHQDTTEQRRLEAELLHAQKMEAIGRLAGGVAHDINNSLQAIIGYADLLLDSDADATMVGRIKGSAERSATLARELLAFGEKQMLQPRVVDAAAAVAGLEARLRDLAGDGIELRLTTMSDAGHIRVDPDSLAQVLTDLVANARDAMPDGGQVTIATGLVSFDDSEISRHFGIAPGDYVSISVTDSGPGMSPEVRERLFEPFFTTKPFGGSAGLGLAAAYGAVRQANGQIHVYSEPGLGTTIRLYFPAVEASTANERSSAGPPGRRVLLVEDEPALGSLLETIMRRAGFEVRVVGSTGAAAEELFGGSQPFDVLVSDVALGSEDGRALARRARATFPAMRVILMSGFDEHRFRGSGDLPADAFIAKPFPPAEFVRLLESTLGRPR